MSHKPPLPDLSSLPHQNPICILTQPLPPLELTRVLKSLRRGWRDVSMPNNVADFSHLSYLSSPSLKLRDLFSLSAHLAANGFFDSIAIDHVSGRDNSVIVAHFNADEKYLQIGRQIAKEAAWAMDQLSHGLGASLDFDDVVDGEFGDVKVLRNFDQGYGGSVMIADSTQKMIFPQLSLQPEYPAKRMTVVCLVKVSDGERGELKQDYLNAVGPEIEDIEIVRWENSREATRADIYSLLFDANAWMYGRYNEIRNTHIRHVLFIDRQALRNKEVILAHAVRSAEDQPFIAERFVRLCRVPQAKLGSLWRDIVRGGRGGPAWDYLLNTYATDTTSEEKIEDPNVAFGLRKPLYLPQNEVAGGAPPLFFLQKDFSAEERVRTIKELTVSAQSFNAKYPEYCLIPWVNDKAGTAEDIVRIVAFLHFANLQDSLPIFVDSQSGQDGSVIIADCSNIRWKETTPMRIMWGRLPGWAAHMNIQGLSVANQSFEETVSSVEEIEKSEQELRDLAADVEIPESEGEWRDIWDRFVRAHGGDSDGSDESDENEEDVKDVEAD